MQYVRINMMASNTKASVVNKLADGTYILIGKNIVGRGSSSWENFKVSEIFSKLFTCLTYTSYSSNVAMKLLNKTFSNTIYGEQY